MTFSAAVLIADKLTTEDATQLSADFEAIGLAADLREVPRRRSLDDVAWYILAAIPLQPFFSKLAEDLASDAHDHLKSVITRILRRRSGTPSRNQRLLVLQDSRTGVQIVIEPDLPPESYRQLLDVDLSSIRRGRLRYDTDRNRWCSDPAEEK